MILVRIIKRERVEALSDRVVICLVVCLVMGCIALAWATTCALVNAGHPLLALLTFAPLGTGLGMYCVEATRYCRPKWFKPSPSGDAA
jgi:hypothetical protein